MIWTVCFFQRHISLTKKALPLFEMHQWAFFLVKETVYSCGCSSVAALSSEITWVFTFLVVWSLTRNDAYFFNTSRKQTILFNGGLRQFEISAFSKVLRNLWEMHHSGLKLRVDLDNRKKFLTVRIMRHWNRLLKNAVDIPPLEVFKARLAGALSNLV